ncbi:hypothetical protein [Citricoccus sp. SGAir0253]|uniref:hypothetical protein n=1 Tax=Citricoccus sp. SGAir0253 TaxID=2567881 RepID=UPI001FED2F1E|nr:hypothetical protein [Citricoccus sp. SGAir0253]
MHAVESGSPRHSGAPVGRARAWAAKGSGVTFAVMVVVLLVALLFAANQNDVIGWLLVIIAAGWLVLAVVVVLGVRRGARSVDRRMKDMSASLAPRLSGEPAPRAAEHAAADPMRDTKLDHSFKIVQVQARVVGEELAKGATADTDMVARALETIQITAANARDMIKDASGAGTAGPGRPSSGTGREAGGAISGEVIN